MTNTQIKALLDAAKTLTKADCHEQVISCLEQAIEIEPEIFHLHHELGCAHMKLDQHDQAIECFQKSIEISPEYTVSRNCLCNAYLEKGQPEEAIEAGKKAIEIDPEHAAAHNNIGYAYMELGQLDKAIEHFQKAIEHNPMENTTRRLNAYSNPEPGRYLFNSATDPAPSNPGNAVAHANLGLAYMELSEYNMAAEYLRTAKELAQEQGLNEIATKCERRLEKCRQNIIAINADIPDEPA